MSLSHVRRSPEPWSIPLAPIIACIDGSAHPLIGTSLYAHHLIFRIVCEILDQIMTATVILKEAQRRCHTFFWAF